MVQNHFKQNGKPGSGRSVQWLCWINLSSFIEIRTSREACRQKRDQPDQLLVDHSATSLSSWLLLFRKNRLSWLQLSEAQHTGSQGTCRPNYRLFGPRTVNFVFMNLVDFWRETGDIVFRARCCYLEKTFWTSILSTTLGRSNIAKQWKLAFRSCILRLLWWS